MTRPTETEGTQMARKTNSKRIEDQEQFSLFRPEEVSDVQLDLFQEKDPAAPTMWADLFGK